MPPLGDDPNGGDDTADDSLSELKKDILRVISAVENEESFTEGALQKFCLILGRSHDVDPFKLYSIYLRGPYSKDVKKAGHELCEDGLVNIRPSRSRKVNTDIFELTEEGEKVLEEFGKDPGFEDAYKRFQSRYGVSGSWKKYDGMVYSWLSKESNYVAEDYSLFTSLERKVQFSDNFDTFFENCIRASKPAFASDFETDTADLAKLAYYLAENKKCPSNSQIKQIDHSIRFSIRNILKYWHSDPVDSENKIALLRGHIVRIQDEEKIFYLKEDRLQNSPSIRVEFYGEWDEDPRKILENYSIGVLGYVTESNGEVTIKTLAIIQAVELPESLQSTETDHSFSSDLDGDPDDSIQQTSLTEYDNQEQTDPSPSETDQTTLSEHRNQQQATLERLEELGDEFIANHDGEVSKEHEEAGWIDTWEEVIEDLDDIESINYEELRHRLQEISEDFDGAVGKMIKIGFLYELLRWILRNWPF